MSLRRVFIFLLLSAIPSKAATLSGAVLDSEGATLPPRAHIIVHWDGAGSIYLKDNLAIKQNISATSDSAGRFSLELPPGFYEVFVTAPAFSPHCEKIRLKGIETKTYKVKLKVSAVVSKELD